jgi:hypothetical protein
MLITRKAIYLSKPKNGSYIISRLQASAAPCDLSDEFLAPGTITSEIASMVSLLWLDADMHSIRSAASVILSVLKRKLNEPAVFKKNLLVTFLYCIIQPYKRILFHTFS